MDLKNQDPGQGHKLGLQIKFFHYQKTSSSVRTGPRSYRKVFRGQVEINKILAFSLQTPVLKFRSPLSLSPGPGPSVRTESLMCAELRTSQFS